MAILNNRTSNDIWTVSKLLEAQSNKSDKEVIKLPSFQRNLVWSNEQTEKFIDSLKKGYPIGSLLFYKSKGEDNKEVYLLIDGLQRTTALVNYSLKPTEYFSEEDIDRELVVKVKEYIYSNNKILIDEEEIINVITDWVRNIKGLKEANRFSSHYLVRYIMQKFNLTYSDRVHDNLTETFAEFIDTVKESANINQLSIAVQIYNGSMEELPEIFNRINALGTQLNKYQILAAVWSDEKYQKIKIENKDLINYISKRYDNAISKGYIVEGYSGNNKSFEESEFNSFEYIYGLGKWLMCNEKYNGLFNTLEEKKNKEASSFIFSLLAACLVKDVKSVTGIPNYLSKITSLTKFESALLNCLDLTMSHLNPYISVKLNIKGSKKIIYHSEMQLVSIVASIFSSLYDENINEKNISSEQLNKLMRNITHYYLYDVLRDNWRGSGDTRANKYLNNETYKEEISKDSWSVTLDEWFQSQLNERAATRSTLDKSKKLFLCYLNTHLIPVYRNFSVNNDQFEHIVPVKRISDEIEKGKMEPTAINCIGNIGLLGERINNQKKENTIFEYYNNVEKVLIGYLNGDVKLKKEYSRILKGDKRVENLKTAEEASQYILQKKIQAEKELFIKEKELNLKKILTKNSYITFLKNRFTKLKEEFLELNKIY